MIEAMKQALEALDCIYSPLHVREINKVAAAMNVLRQALSEAQLSVNENSHAIEQAERQEPLGYFTINDYDKWEQIDGTSGKPLYEAPQVTPQPQREWVGLTHDEVPEQYKCDSVFVEGWLWAEAKLKEKNNVS
jgi:hypothetical protein